MKKIVLIALMLLASNSQAGERKTILKFITLEVSPWASTDTESGKQIGVFPEIIAEIEKRSGYKINTTLTPFARVDRELESGQHDCTILIERDEQVVIRGALVSYHPIGVIARKGVPLKKYDDLLPLTVSILRGATVEERFDADERIKKEFDTDYSIGLRKIAHGRLDAIVGALPTIHTLAKEHGLADKLGDELLLANVPLVLQCSRNSAYINVMPMLNNTIEEMKKDGTLDKIKSKYYF